MGYGHWKPLVLVTVHLCLPILGESQPTLEVLSKPSIAFKVKAGRVGQPQEYTWHFEDWTARPNAGFGREGRF